VYGELLDPVLPAVAAAQAAGDVSSEQAHVITRTLEAFPPDLTVAELTAAEAHVGGAGPAGPPGRGRQGR
jgi:hypothetical protein